MNCAKDALHYLNINFQETVNHDSFNIIAIVNPLQYGIIQKKRRQILCEVLLEKYFSKPKKTSSS